MNRRAFLMKTAMAGLGLASLPFVSRLQALPVALAAQGPLQESMEEPVATESEALEDILSYIDSWVAELPGADIKGSVLQHLVAEQTGASHEKLAVDGQP